MGWHRRGRIYWVAWHHAQASISHASPLFSSRYRFRLRLREWVAVRRVAPGSCREMQEPNTVQGFHPETGTSDNGVQNRCSLLLEAQYSYGFKERRMGAFRADWRTIS